MGISLQLENMTRLFDESPITPIFLNDLSSVTEEDRENIAKLTTTRYVKTDVFSNQPSCDCGKITGGFNLGVTCNSCRTQVTELFSQDLIPQVWIKSPNGVAPLINPGVLSMLSDKFTKSGFNFIEWLTNTDYVPSGDKPNQEIDELLAKGVQRGYNNFVYNFDQYFEILCSLKHFAKKRDDDLGILIRSERDCVFSKYLALPNKGLLIEEHTNVGSYADPMALRIVDAIRTISSIDTPMFSYTQRQKENRTIKTLFKCAEFYREAYHLLFAKKLGLIRKQCLGTRAHWSGRGVISSETDRHKYDCIAIPWGQGVTVLSIHLKNKLLTRGYTSNAAEALLQKHTAVYSPIIDSLFHELFAEAKNNSFACIFVRNPSLGRGSTKRMFIDRVKTDPNDITISLSILAVKSYNADFDGKRLPSINFFN